VLTVVEMQSLACRMTYKPGWTFEVREGAHEGTHLTIKTMVPDAYRPEELTSLNVETFLPPFLTEEQFYNTVLWRIKRIEIHEALEFFRVDGKPWNDPHRPDADRDQ
jgi:hypothetical protein